MTPEGTTDGRVSPDGRRILVQTSAGGLWLYPAEGGQGKAVPATTSEDTVVRWSADGRSVIVFGASQVPARLERLDLESGKREFLRTIGPADLTGVLSIFNLNATEDAGIYAYTCRRTISHLFLVDGAR